MKLNGIDFNNFSDKELIELCLKYKLIDTSKKYNRNDLLNLLKSFIIEKLNKKKQQKSNIKSFSIDNDKDYKEKFSFSGNTTNSNNRNGVKNKCCIKEDYHNRQQLLKNKMPLKLTK